MGVCEKKDPSGNRLVNDDIHRAPIMDDPEKKQPVYDYDVETALPQFPPTIAGMEEDLNLTGNRYSWLLTIFYIAYVTFGFAAFMWKIMPPHQWAAITALSWGIAATCQAAVQNWEGLMALRFLLGMSEVAFGPGIPYLLSFFYRRRELGFRCGLFFSTGPLANTFAGALAYGITSGHSKLANWRLLFLVEGCPSLLAAVLAWRFLPDSPSSARFLTEEEKEVARARSLRQSGERERSSKIDWKDLARTLLDAKAWITALMYFSCNVSFSSLPVFLPTVLKDMGFTSINAQGLTAPPYFASFLVTIATTWMADRLQQRGLTITFLSLIGAVGYVLLTVCKSVGVRYAGVFLAAIGVFPSIANILPWVLNNQGSDSRRGMGIVILNLIGQCGPFLGTNIFPASDGPHYIRGQSICAAFMFLTTALALALRTLLVRENRRLDKQHGTQAEREAWGWNKNDSIAEENYGAGFRFVLYNGIRFSITDVSPPTARTMPTVYQDRAAISLYDAQFSAGSRRPIPPDIIDQVVDRLVGFQITCDDFGVPAENISVLATEATRTAPKSEEFRARIKDRTGWEVRLLSKEDEGRIGALGIASSASSVAGIAMDLGGGSTQITWVVEKDGVVTTSPKGSFSFPYGAAALTKRLEQAKGEGKKAEKALKEEMIRNFQDAYQALEIPEILSKTAKALGRFDLYLCGGGFRGWGYVLMKQSKVDPYPIPIINGFRVRRGDFHDTVSVLDVVSDSDERIFGVSKRRASQIPAVAVLVNVIMDALPDITHIQFSQGGVREGFLFDRIPQEVRAQDPLLAASLPYASPSSDAIRELLASALPTSSPIASCHTPATFSPQLVGALANLLFAHSRVPRESRSAVALHSTTTGILASVNTLSHAVRALIALILCERWAGDLAPTDQTFHRQLIRCVSAQEAWWCQYLGRVATLIGDMHPAGRVPETNWRIRLETGWESIVKKNERCDLLRLKVKCNQDVAAPVLLDSLQEMAEKVEKVGKRKNWIKDYGVRVGVTIC
ncbi:major facilitator superfamily domain-containing protein [Aspergillus coremiiformis]|uniref:Major facilitator superfamily domain-containing protein n=1 Tax=Aspergillus coremiiformis TaxID=138285 RepID=A0A5N6Z7G7_9EURO|nr:major facilitator superfamily domain-containing protein [Aspergillus coremiiformis]